MLIIAPILQLIVFGYAINMDVDKIPTIICDQDDTVKAEAWHSNSWRWDFRFSTRYSIPLKRSARSSPARLPWR